MARPRYLKYPTPFLPIMCSSTSAPSRSNARTRAEVSLMRLALNAPASPRLLVIPTTAARRMSPSTRRSNGNRSTRIGSWRSRMISASAAAYGRAAITRSLARFNFDVATISIVFVIWRVLSTDLMRRRSSRGWAIYCNALNPLIAAASSASSSSPSFFSWRIRSSTSG